MYRMRPALVSDRAGIERLAADRFRWMADQGHALWPQGAREIAAKAGRAPMWCLLDDDRLCGLTIVVEQLGTAAWTESERREPSLLLTTTLTDPARAGQQLGARIAWWAVDRAARQGKQWTRRVTTEPRLAAYYQRQGFTLVREGTHQGRPLHALQRAATLLDDPLKHVQGP